MKKLTAVFLLAFCYLNLVAQNNMPSYVPTNGLVAYYPFNGNANDESGNGNHGIVNGATLANDRFGNTNKAYYYNGSSNFIDFGNIHGLDSTNFFSVSTWFKYTSIPSPPNDHFTIVCDGGYGDSNGWGLLVNQDGVLIRSQNSTPALSSEWACLYINQFLINTWYNVTAVLNSDSIKIYVNGQYHGGISGNYVVNSNSISLNTSDAFKTGKGSNQNNANTYFFSGVIDDICLFNRPLTQQEITALYNTGQSSNNTNTDTTANTTKPVPPGIPYQAVIRNASGQIMTNANVTSQFTLHKDSAIGGVEYQEVHSLTTNGHGLINTVLGKGSSTQGTFAGINWANTNKFLQVQIDLGNGYVDLGTQQLMSVPYAMYAANGPKGEKGDKGEKGNGFQNGTSKGQMMYWDDSAWVTVAPGSQGQTLTFCDGKPHWGACPPVITPVHYGNGLTDIDGNTYDTVSICNQVWMKQNLNVSRYRNGDIIPQVTDPTQWSNLTTGAWCYYNNDSANVSVYGKLYNWYAVKDSRGLAPDGWHVSSNEEWQTLRNCLGTEHEAGGKLKEAGINHWKYPNIDASNSSDFGALPGGYRYHDGNFYFEGYWAQFWTTSEFSNTDGWNRGLHYNEYNNFNNDFYNNKTDGFSVRCVRNLIIPTLSTNTISSITTTSATSGGNITNDGGGNITVRGICWSTSNNPTIDLTTKTTDGTGTGSFTSSITGLSPNTTYYVSAYATNSAGTSYGSEMSFTTQSVNNNTGVGLTDIDGNTYDTVRICNQTWTKKNLNVSRYRNGDIIPQVTDPTQWSNLTTGAWCYYNNDSANGSVYGKLYNWYAINDPIGLAPEGWHVPNDGEWTTLTDCLGGADVAGGKMKNTGTTHWNSPNIGATNSCGFNALPGGYIDPWGSFVYNKEEGIFWTATSVSSSDAWYRYLVNYTSEIYKGYNGFFNDQHKTDGFSVRLVKDEPPYTLNDGLVAYYPFNGNANDESGNGNNGVVNGATLTTDRFGYSGKAYSFDNLDNVINVPEISPSLGSPNSSASYSMWFKGQSAIAYPGASGVILHSNTNPNNFDYQIRFEVGFSSYLGSGFRKKVYYRCPAENNEPYSLDEYDTNIWHNILVVVNGASGEYKYYFDGVLDSNMYFHFNPQNNYYLNNRTWQIGSYSPQPNHASHQFYGKIDDIRIYNRALTQEEVSYLATH